ncbi:MULTISPECIES: PspC domain-containing protein [unclassified Microbacterium]|uniref:PspC domain-containing protein n=1 Tax=unclassified Microbacterium TaxID=2609290 RepID=UPI0030158BFD
MTTPHQETSPPSASPTPSRRASDRFFAWTAGLGLVRGDGWIGGVAAGIGARLRIDPLIVRGILVVAGLFGLPVPLLYAFAWGLLPDLDGRIPLRDALHGRFETAQVGILVVALFGLVPVMPALLFVGGIPSWMSAPGLGGWSPLSAVAALVGAVLVAGLLFVIVRAARRTAYAVDPAAPSTQRTASAASGEPAPSAVGPGSGPGRDADAEGVDAAGFAASTLSLSPSLSSESPPAPLPPGDAPPASDDAAYAAWREQHASWRAQEDAWRREQQDADRAARDQARRERQERAAAFTAAAEERRRLRRATSPRTPFAFVATAVGVALVAGTVAAVQQDGPLALARGLFVVALVLAVAMAVAGTLRRRSGFLAFVTAVALGAGAIAVAVPTATALHVGSQSLSNIHPQGRASAADPFVQPWGDLWISLEDTGHDGDLHVDRRNAIPGSSNITQIAYARGVAIEIDLTTRGALVEHWRTGPGAKEFVRLDDAGLTATTLPDGRTRYTGTLGDEDARTRVSLFLEQDGGSVVFQRGDDDPGDDAPRDDTQTSEGDR